MNDKKGITIVSLVIFIVASLILITLAFGTGRRYITKTNDVKNNFEQLEQARNDQNQIEDEAMGIGASIDREKRIVDVLELGDYIEYSGGNNSISFLASETGSNAQSFSPENIVWRVWSKNKTTGEVKIIPERPVNQLELYGYIGLKNSISLIERLCDIYANNSMYNVTTDDVKSLSLNDVESPEISDAVIQKYNYINAEGYIYNQSLTYTSGVFYMASDGLTVLDSPNMDYPVTINNTYYWTDHTTWKPINNSKFYSRATYGDILGYYTEQNSNHFCWIPSTITYITGVRPQDVTFGLMNVAGNAIALGDYLCDAAGNEYSASYGVRPLVTLRTNLQIDKTDSTRDGSSPEKAWQLIKD